MKRICIFILSAVWIIGMGSCSKNFLNVSPKDQYSDNAVWNDPNLIQAFVDNIYGGIPHGFDILMMSSLSDEAVFTPDWGAENVNRGLLSPSDLEVFDPGFWGSVQTVLRSWKTQYKYIRACNLFFSKIDAAPIDESLKQRMKGEVHFLRAYLYFQLVEMYGGVPIITQAYTLTDSFNVPRNTFAECVDFITKECDSAAALLPLTYSGNDVGRATKGAALALKARMLLYAASDLFNSQASWAPGYSHPELVSYVGGDRMARWQAAKDAAKAVMDLGIYDLYKPNPQSAQEAAQNYQQLFLQQSTPEDIFVKFFTQKVNENWMGYSPGQYCQPNGWHCWGNNTPTQQMVDMYEMADGTPFDWNNPAEAANPYANRDPRFYASILYNGAQWRPRPSDVAPLDPNGIVQTGYWAKWNPQTNTVDTIPGLDTRKSPFENWNGTYTGYYMKKFMDPTVDAQFIHQTVPWRYIRYTEILLDYAEACLALGQETEAKTYINMIRQRAYMPPITSTGQQLINDYRREREVELAFEDQRYFDVRRWMIADSAYQDAKGILIIYPLLPDHTTSPTPTYKVYSAIRRAWQPHAYFLPIQLDEINRNQKLIQNPGY